MTDLRQAGKIPRIVIGLRAGADFDPSVGAATTLAAAIKAEILGLFVQEEAMFDLAGLPFARVSKFGSTKTTPLTARLMAAAMTRSAEMCRRALSAHADKAQIRWSFSIEQGELPLTLKGNVVAGDFLVLSGIGRGLGAAQLIDELRTVPSEIRGIVIAAGQKSAGQKGPVVAIDDGDVSGELTLSLARQVAKAANATIELFVVASTDAEAERIIERARTMIEPAQRLIIKRFSPRAPEAIASALIRGDPSFVVADREGEPFHDDEAAIKLLRAARAPVVLVRRGNSADAE